MLQQIGKYRIEGTLGHGAMGVVYRGMDDTLQRPVAIKTIHAHLLQDEFGEQLLQRFKTEALAAARCQHSNIVTVYDFGQHEGMPYIAMEFVKGRGLDDVLKECDGALPLKRINTLVMGICRGLHYAHQQGIVHRDMKPANVMVLDGDAVKIADFGIARLPTSDLTQIGSQLGTPSYMPPEQREGTEVDQRADIFALGVMIFELLARCPDIPEALCVQTVAAIKELPPTKKLDRNKHFPRSIATFLEKCIHPEASLRYANIAQLVEAYKHAMLSMRGGNETVPAPRADDPDATVVGRHPAQAPAPGATDPGFYKTMSVQDQTRIAEARDNKAKVAEDEPEVVRRAFPLLDAIRALKVIDPVLNPDWEARVGAIMAPLDENARQRAFRNVIKPKNIEWDKATNRFVFQGRPTVRELATSLTTPQLTALADKLNKVLATLGESRNITTIADALEGGLSNIDRFNPEENQQRQKEKLKLREAFLYDFAGAIRAVDFDVPQTQRGLTAEAIRTYIIEVFIKQQIMGYWFSTTPIYELKKDPSPFVQGTVVNEARVRRFDIVTTDHFYFLVGPVVRFDQNQYSVRRFLSEDTAMGGRLVYFNSVAVDRRQLGNAQAEQKTAHDITRIITIQRQLSARILELVDSFETNQHKYLLPLLFKPLAADGTDLETAIEQRLQDWEKSFSRLVIGKIPHALRELAKGQDDFEYLYFGLRTFLLEVLGNIQDFSAQSSAQWSTKGQELEYRIASYLRLLEKRKPTVFTGEAEAAAAAASDAALDTTLPGAELKKILDEAEPQLAELADTLKEAIHAATGDDGKGKFLGRLLGRKKKVDPDEVRAEIASARRNAFLGIVRVPKRYPKITVYLEFEDLVEVDDRVRHYAFPNGDHGLALLPYLIELPEDKEQFEIRSVRRVLEFDLFKAAQRWGKEAAIAPT
ncbi:MAG TPA: serine/threonine-protein kinase [Moraxellaceae bacterium]|nr:serine/threonine-protein kinase [Moraxellaceae bacterium]